MSLPFDDLVDAFEGGRGLPLVAQEALITLINELAEGRRLRLLDVGAGTGRLALPILVRGHDLVALDLARPMLDRLARKLAEVGPLLGTCRLVQGNVAALPFPDGSFDVALLANVLYLVPNWRHALAEVVRVLGPDGALLLAVEQSRPSAALAAFDARWRSIIEATDYVHPPLEPNDDAVLEAVSAAAASSTTRTLAEWEIGETLEATLDGYAERLRPLYASVPDDAWREAVTRFTGWAREAFPDPATRLDCTVTLEVTVARGWTEGIGDRG